MGKQANENRAAQLKQFREEMLKKQQEDKRRQLKITLLIIAIALVICAAIALLILFLPKNTEPTDKNEDIEYVDPSHNHGPEPTFGELDTKEIDLNNYTETQEVTDLVQMSVSYTDRDGVKKTGNIAFRLYDEVAPTTVNNFQKLVKSGFYNGSSFHRVMKDFMIQGGSGEGENKLTPIHGEFTNNGFVNHIDHIRGVVSMARSNDPNSAAAQFFIMHKDNINLDGNYAAFGYVVYGMETVDEIAETEVAPNPVKESEKSSPVNPVTINYIKFIAPTSK